MRPICRFGSTVSADSTNTSAGKDLKVNASNLVSTQDTYLKAGGDIQLLAAQDTTNEYYDADSSQVTLGGVNTNLGASYNKITTENRRDSSIAQASDGGDLSIQSNSNIIAQGANLRSGGLTTLDAAKSVTSCLH